MTDSNKDTERGEKRGILATGRAKDLAKTKDADADAAADETETDTETETEEDDVPEG